MREALLIIDVQNDYFPGGTNELVHPYKAEQRIRELIADSRAVGRPVIYIQHFNPPDDYFFLEGTKGAEISDRIRPEDLEGLPLFCSELAWNGELKNWAGSSFSKLHLEGSFRLSYNGSVFAREGLGYLLTFRHLIDTSEGSGLVFRPLDPPLETRLFIAWNRFQSFTPIAERFLQQLKSSFRLRTQ